MGNITFIFPPTLYQPMGRQEIFTTGLLINKKAPFEFISLPKNTNVNDKIVVKLNCWVASYLLHPLGVLR